MDNQIPVTYSNHKPILILIFLGILIILLLIAGFIYFRTQSKKTDLIIQSKIIDLTKGKVVDLKDNLGFYIEQSPEVCSQNNLNKTYFKSFVLSKEATASGARSVYGETTWNYALQGEISNIQSVADGIKYTLTNGENILITQTTNNTISWVKNPSATSSGNLVPTKVDASTISIKDKVYLYYLVKCGGNRPPLLFLEYIQKANTTPQQPIVTATSSGGLKTRSNNWQGFRGTVKEKGANFLVLVGGGQTMKVEIGNNIHLRIINESEAKQNPELYSKKPPQETPISGVKIGETVDVTGEYTGTSFKAAAVIVIR